MSQMILGICVGISFKPLVHFNGEKVTQTKLSCESYEQDTKFWQSETGVTWYYSNKFKEWRVLE